MKKNNFVFKKDKTKINNNNMNNNTNNIINKEQNIINRNNIYSKSSIDKIKDITEKNTGNKIEIKKNKNIIIFDCKYKEEKNIIYFRLNISKYNKDFFTISPVLIKGNQFGFKNIIEKIKNKLM